MALNETLARLAQLRKLETEAKARVTEARAALEETEEYKQWSIHEYNRRVYADCIDETVQTARREALEAFQATGDKAPLPGVQIKLYKRYVYDPETTFDWLMFNAPAYLTIDAKRFEKAVETLVGAPVTIENEPRPTIASDLSGYLSE